MTDSRTRLAQATRQVISEKGLQGVGVREIARAAAMSPGSVLYHFPANDDLIFEVHRAAVADYLDARTRSQSGVRDPRRKLVRAVLSGIPSESDREVVSLLFEMQSLARRSEDHAALMTDLWLKESEFYAAIVRAGADTGDFVLKRPAEEVAAMLLATEDGLASHLVSNNDALTSSHAVNLMLGLASSELGCPELLAIRRPRKR
jgi:AcrR family transcriptional regulator